MRRRREEVRQEEEEEEVRVVAKDGHFDVCDMIIILRGIPKKTCVCCYKFDYDANYYIDN